MEMKSSNPDMNPTNQNGIASDENTSTQIMDDAKETGPVGEVAVSELVENFLAWHVRLLCSLDATGRPDESLAVEIDGLFLGASKEENFQKGTMLSLAIKEGQLKPNVCYQPRYSSNVEVSN
ncbi:hypothetical protein C5167_009532 [Papaver somniferum]|uniref:Uncharacterized protein n=1 Tax=Papaver somniferum TaxID=3469 RepID=A0A4Y7K0K2_PAPSO|nr:hypothetical protein C5167_009532 [Papaver somniferum]